MKLLWLLRPKTESQDQSSGSRKMKMDAQDPDSSSEGLVQVAVVAVRRQEANVTWNFLLQMTWRKRVGQGSSMERS